MGPGSKSVEGGAWLRGRSMGNELLEIRVGSGGAITLVDRRTRQLYRDVLSLESSGDVGDTYTYAPPRPDRTVRARGNVAVIPLADGPLGGGVGAALGSEPRSRQRKNPRGS